MSPVDPEATLLPTPPPVVVDMSLSLIGTRAAAYSGRVKTLQQCSYLNRI